VQIDAAGSEHDGWYNVGCNPITEHEYNCHCFHSAILQSVSLQNEFKIIGSEQTDCSIPVR